ncbi:MAG: GNAT family N-acetyltransferase [Acidimicrobiales bacterium]
MTRTPMSDPDVFLDTEEHRYEIMADGGLAGFALYDSTGGSVRFTHTEIQRRFTGRGLGARLIGAALDDVRRQGRTATPVCPFVAGYIRRHPEYVDLVDAAHRGPFTG